MSPPGSPPAAATHWPAVAAAVLAGYAIALNIGKVPVALPVLRQELGLTLVQAGWVSSMLTTVAVLSAAGVGMWVGRLGALRMVLAGLVICAGASVAAALLPMQGAAGWPVLIGSRFIEGLGFMVVAVACPALITAASGAQDRRFALALWSTYMPAGASLAMAVAPGLLPHTGWRGLWLITGLALLVAAAGVWAQRPRYAVPAPPAGAAGAPASFLGPVREALGHPLPWLLALIFGLWATQHFALIVWMPTYLQEARGFGALSASLLTALMLVACVPGNLLGGALVQRGLPRGRLIVWSQVGTALGALAYGTEALPDALRYAGAVFVSFIGGLIPAAVMASSTVLARTPQQIGTLQGLYMQGAQLGQFIGTPLVAAVVAASRDWRSALAVTLPAALLAVLLGLWSHRLETRVQPRQEAA